MRELVAGLDVAAIEGSDLAAVSVDGTPYVNVNTPADLANAEALQRRRAHRP